MSQILTDEQQEMYNFGYYARSTSESRQTFVVTLEDGEDGWIVARCPELNAVTQGRTIEEAEKNMIEAIEVSLEDEHKQFSISAKRLYE